MRDWAHSLWAAAGAVDGIGFFDVVMKQLQTFGHVEAFVDFFERQFQFQFAQQNALLSPVEGTHHPAIIAALIMLEAHAVTRFVTRTDDSNTCGDPHNCPGTFRDVLTRVQDGDVIEFDLEPGPRTIQLASGSTD